MAIQSELEKKGTLCSLLGILPSMEHDMCFHCSSAMQGGKQLGDFL